MCIIFTHRLTHTQYTYVVCMQLYDVMFRKYTVQYDFTSDVDRYVCVGASCSCVFLAASMIARLEAKNASMRFNRCDIDGCTTVELDLKSCNRLF